MKHSIIFLLTALLCAAALYACSRDTPAASVSGTAEPETIHYQDISGDYLFVSNSAETERMLLSLHEYLGDKDIQIQTFVPEDIVSLAERSWDPAWAAGLTGGDVYCIHAWDIYKNGEFQRTTYQVGKR